MTTLARNTLIKIQMNENGKFEVSGRGESDAVLFTDSDTFSIYLKTARFRTDGSIVGIYLGDTDSNMSNGVGDYTEFKDGAWKIDGRRIEKARFVTLDSSLGVKVLVRDK